MSSSERSRAPHRLAQERIDPATTPGVHLGSWQTDEDGRFATLGGSLRDLLVLPLVPVGALRWDDLVIPGTDLAFLELPSFDRRTVAVGVRGGVRRWVLSGRCTGPGRMATGTVEQLEGPAIDRP